MIDARDHPQVTGCTLLSAGPAPSMTRGLSREGFFREGAGPPKRDPRTVRGGSAEAEAPWAEFLQGHGLRCRDGVTDATLRTAGRDDETFRSFNKNRMEGCDPLRFHSIIVRENQLHQFRSDPD